MASWKFIRTEQKPIECKFLALDKTENRSSERKEKEKNKRKKAMVAVSVFIIIGDHTKRQTSEIQGLY